MYLDTLDRGAGILIRSSPTAIITTTTTSYPGVRTSPKQVIDTLWERGKTMVKALPGKAEV
jgi:hypothetical protein